MFACFLCGRLCDVVCMFFVLLLCLLVFVGCVANAFVCFLLVMYCVVLHGLFVCVCFVFV